MEAFQRRGRRTKAGDGTRQAVTHVPSRRPPPAISQQRSVSGQDTSGEQAAC